MRKNVLERARRERHSVVQALAWWAIGLLLMAGSLLMLDPSTSLYLAVVHADLVLPRQLASGMIIVLALLLAVATWRGGPWRTRRTLTGLTAGVGVVIAYVSSESVKALLAQNRPCRSILLDPSCPEVGNWSFPSNHATIAFGLATAIALVVPRWWAAWTAYPAALIAGASRVIDGVHYPHDVLAGAALGVCTTVAVTRLLPRGLGGHDRERLRKTSRPTEG